MKKEIAVFTLALGLVSTAPAFAGEEKITPKKQPVKMTDVQMDAITGGQQEGLINVSLDNVEIVKNVNVGANVIVGILSGPQGAVTVVRNRP
jgi:hypothetical protein